MRKERQQPHVCPKLLVPAANQNDANPVSTLAGDPAVDAGENIQY